MSSLTKPATGKQLKLKGIKQVSDSHVAWLNATMPALKAWLSTIVAEGEPTFTHEQFKAYAREHGLTLPRHVNAWGALARIASTRGLCEWTGHYVPAEAPSAHGRAIKLWRALA